MVPEYASFRQCRSTEGDLNPATLSEAAQKGYRLLNRRDDAHHYLPLVCPHHMNVVNKEPLDR